ncbi:MAG: hypothetical protein COA92_02000 [Sulfurovum sp.]|nr:MAG: hypothetical protein COA92_02000 [Sulfurovum sp.]
MRVFTIIAFFVHILYAQEMNYKMIISAHIESQEAAKSLYEIETFFQENKAAKEIKLKYNLALGMELLDKYIIITLKPIKVTSVKNELKYLLQEKFPENFIVGNTFFKDLPKQYQILEDIYTEVESSKVKKKNTEKFVSKNLVQEKPDGLELFWQEMQSEWFGLLFLALAGFILIYRSAKQISKIKKLQKEVTQYQSKLENEVNRMGERHG